MQFQHTSINHDNMNAETEEKIIPDQIEGTQKDIECTVTTLNNKEAQELFFRARNRLLDINHWKDYSGTGSSNFVLTDAQGNEVTRMAEEGDYFKIDIPAPGPVSGDGFDWVYIEIIEDNSDVDAPYENIAMRVRPSKNPSTKGENISHFFSNKSTSSFVVSRHNKNVSAVVYGRNEIPNTSTSNIVDKVRNVVVGTSARLGLSDIQWQNLVNGLLNTR